MSSSISFSFEETSPPSPSQNRSGKIQKRPHWDQILYRAKVQGKDITIRGKLSQWEGKEQLFAEYAEKMTKVNSKSLLKLKRYPITWNTKTQELSFRGVPLKNFRDENKQINLGTIMQLLPKVEMVVKGLLISKLGYLRIAQDLVYEWQGVIEAGEEIEKGLQNDLKQEMREHKEEPIIVEIEEEERPE